MSRLTFNSFFMDIILKILTLGIYGLFTKSRKVKQTVKKTKKNKVIERTTEYESDEPTPLETED